VTWYAWESALAGIVNITAYVVQSLVEMNFPDYTPQRYQLTLLVIAILVETLMNIYTFRLIPWIELLAGILHLILFIVFVAVFIALAPKHSSNFGFFDRATASGWENGFISWNLGLLTPMWGFIGESPGSTAELYSLTTKKDV
jgi:choline transport protein